MSCVYQPEHTCACVHVFVSGCVYQSQYMDASYILATHHHTCTPLFFLFNTCITEHHTQHIPSQYTFQTQYTRQFSPTTHSPTHLECHRISQGSKQGHIVCILSYITSLINLTLYSIPVYIIINPRRACAARVTVVVLCVCVSVCVCVYDYSRTTGYEAAYERYQQLQCYKGKKNNVAILLKPLRSGDMA